MTSTSRGEVGRWRIPAPQRWAGELFDRHLLLDDRPVGVVDDQLHVIFEDGTELDRYDLAAVSAALERASDG